MPKQSIELTSQTPETPLTMDEITTVFSLLGLESEQQREKFRALAQTNQGGEDQAAQFWITGTTDPLETNEGDPHA